jgi:Glycosyl hydrolases family 25
MTLFYPDVSNNNWGSDQDAQDFVAQLIPQGYAGIVHKVSEGSYYEDPYWPVVLAAANAAGLPCLGYHYVTEDPPGAQAAMWVGNGGGKVAMMDWEANGGDVSNLFAVINAFNAAGVTVQLGYVPHWYWEQMGGGGLSFATNGIALVSSDYPVSSGGFGSSLYDESGGDDGEGWASYGGATPTAWQFTDNASIPPYYGIDCNAFKGTDLAAAFGLEAPTPAGPSPL